MEAEKAVQFPIDRAHSVNEDVRTKKGNVRVGVSNSKKNTHLAVKTLKTARRHELVVPGVLQRLLNSSTSPPLAFTSAWCRYCARHEKALLPDEPHSINISMGLEILGVTIPSPYLWVLAFWVFLVLVIADAGGGFPIYFPLLRPFFRPFQPRAVYARLKSKYVVES